MKNNNNLNNNFDIKTLLQTPIKELILESEKFYTSQVEGFANSLFKLKQMPKFILVAGPSSSGKTTSSYIIKKQLAKKGVNTKVISLDDFFLDRHETPILPNGEKDYDSLKSIDWELFSKCTTELIENKESLLPVYDFIEGIKNYSGEKTTLLNNEVIIIEGLHALNPIINNYIPSVLSVKVYICPTSGFELDKQEKINIYNLRLIRRMIRDVRTRGISPEQTLKFWKNVRAAEKEYISPFKAQANFVINTTHAYEPFVYKTILTRLLVNHEKSVQSLLDGLEPFSEITPSMVPVTSLLKEFVG